MFQGIYWMEKALGYLGRRPFPAVCMIVPSASTTSRFTTFSLMVPYRTALVPDALVAAIPHRDASAPGSEMTKARHMLTKDYEIKFNNN